MEENKERKRVKLKLEFYEDELEEFLGLVYLLKNNLTEHQIERKRTDFSSKNNDDDIKQGKSIGTMPSFRDDRPGDYKSGKKGFQVYHDQIKPILYFLKYLLSHFHIESIDSSNPNMAKGLPHLYNFNPSDKKYLDYTGYEDVFNFVSGGNKIPELLDERRREQLACFILYAINSYHPRVEETDRFWEAASNYKNEYQLPRVIKQIIYGDEFFGFRKAPEVYYNNKITYEFKYWLAYRIYDEARMLFPELYNKEVKEGKDYQLKIITGYVMSFMNISVKTEEEFDSKESDTQLKYYRNYLGEKARNWVEKGKEMAPKDWERKL